MSVHSPLLAPPRPRADARPFNRVALVLAVGLLAMFAWFTITFEPQGSRLVDRPWEWLIYLPGPTAHHLMHVVMDNPAALGTAGASLHVAGLLAVLFTLRGRWLAGVALAGGLAIAALVEFWLKLHFGQILRPDIGRVLLTGQVANLAHTYPSGHVARVALITFVEASLLPRPLRLPGGVIAAIFTLLTGLSKVDPGAHTGSDVLGGACLGAGLAALWIGLAPAFPRAQAALEPRLPRPLQRLVATRAPSPATGMGERLRP